MEPAAPGRVTIADGATIEVAGFGAGEPVVVIQTALTGDELLPLTELLAQHAGLRAVHVGRRGYGTHSSPGNPGTTIADMAADCRDAVRALETGPVHVVGASFSCLIALVLATLAPSEVRSLTLIEPPPLDGPGAEQFRAATAELIGTATTHGITSALDEFMPRLYGSTWREDPEFTAPGAAAALERDARAFFEIDLPALLAWKYDGDELPAVRCPVLVIGGDQSAAWFREARELLVQRLPRVEQAIIAGAGHLVATTHPRDLADLTADFVRRHGAARPRE